MTISQDMQSHGFANAGSYRTACLNTEAGCRQLEPTVYDGLTDLEMIKARAGVETSGDFAVECKIQPGLMLTGDRGVCAEHMHMADVRDSCSRQPERVAKPGDCRMPGTGGGL